MQTYYIKIYTSQAEVCLGAASKYDVYKQDLQTHFIFFADKCKQFIIQFKFKRWWEKS